MRFDQNPTYREIIVPWYDSEKACVLMIFFMLLVLLFSLAGVAVAGEQQAFGRHLWVPIVLCIMSSGVIVSISMRLMKRYISRFSK